MAFTLGTSESDLMAQRANTLAAIKARGGKAAAPEYAARLEQIDTALSEGRKNGFAQPAQPSQPAQPQAPVQTEPPVQQPPATQPPVVQQPPIVSQPPIVQQPPVLPSIDPPPVLPPPVINPTSPNPPTYEQNTQTTANQGNLGTDQNANTGDNTARVLPTVQDDGRGGTPGADGKGGNVGEQVTQGNPLADTVNPNVSNADDAAALQRFKDLFGVGEKLGRSMADEFYAPGSLGRLNEQLSPEERDAMIYLRQQAASAGARTPEEQAALDSMNAHAQGAFQQTPEMQDLIARQLAYSKVAGNFTDLENEAIGGARNALGGLSAPENTALREQARRGINQEYAGQLMALQKIQAANQVRGAAAGAQFQNLGASKVNTQRQLEQDLLMKNIEEKRLARESFNNLVGQRTDAASGRQLAANEGAANSMLSDFTTRNAAGTNLLNTYGNQLTKQRGQEASERDAANNLYFTGSSRAGDTLRQLGQYNLSQLAAEKAGQIGSIFGGIGAATQQTGLLRGEMFAGKSLDQQLQMFKDAQDFEEGENAKNRKSNEKIAKTVN